MAGCPCRQRAPRRTWLSTVGTPGAAALVDGPVLATTVVSRTATAVVETVRCTAVHSQPLPADAFAAPVAALAAAHDVRQALVQQAPGQADATHAAYWTGLTTPLALLAGPEATDGRPQRELTGIGELGGARVGEFRWYELRAFGEDPALSWNRLEQVMAHLGTPGLTPDTPRDWGSPEKPVPTA